MKIIIYALGKIFKNHKDKIDWEQVVALSDKDIKSFQNSFNIPVILPKEIYNYDYDYVAVFTTSDSLFEEIRMELTGEYFIPLNKIISWRELIPEEEAMDTEIVQFYQKFLRARNCKRVLDFGMPAISKNYLIKDELLAEGESILDGIYSGKAILNNNLYDCVYGEYRECDKQYDAVLLWKEFSYSEAEWVWITKHARYLLFHTQYLQNGIPIQTKIEEKICPYGKITSIARIEGIFWIIDTKYTPSAEDIAIYVANHRKYHVLSNDLYKPLCVGTYKREGYLTEQTGENIVHLNLKINECTALYWIWKNTNTKYVGLNHYRRYFYIDDIPCIENYLDRETIRELLEIYDIILPKSYPQTKVKIIDQIKRSIDQRLFDKVYIIFRNKIQDKQPDYLEAFDNVMEGYNAFLCNMFVTRREIMNQYCQWLFSFLIESAEEIDVNGYDKYSQRVIGFLAERMWTVWLKRNKLKIKELPYVIIK